MNCSKPKVLPCCPECLSQDGTSTACRCAMLAIGIITVISLAIVTGAPSGEKEDFAADMSGLYTPTVTEYPSYPSYPPYPPPTSATYLPPTTYPPTSYPPTSYASGEPSYPPSAYPRSTPYPSKTTGTGSRQAKSPTKSAPGTTDGSEEVPEGQEEVEPPPEEPDEENPPEE